MASKIIRWGSIPFLLIASMFSGFAARYQALLDLAVCLAAIYLIKRALDANEHLRAAGFGSIAIVFSPLLLVDKLFLLMGLTGIATLISLFAAFRRQPMPTH